MSSRATRAVAPVGGTCWRQGCHRDRRAGMRPKGVSRYQRLPGIPVLCGRRSAGRHSATLRRGSPTVATAAKPVMQPRYAGHPGTEQGHQGRRPARPGRTTRPPVPPPPHAWPCAGRTTLRFGNWCADGPAATGARWWTNTAPTPCPAAASPGSADNLSGSTASGWKAPATTRTKKSSARPGTTPPPTRPLTTLRRRPNPARRGGGHPGQSPRPPQRG
jgi:hypothetical protein